MNIGLDFFIIQIASIILFSTDNFIITQLFGPEQVTPYNIALKYFTIITKNLSTQQLRASGAGPTNRPGREHNQVLRPRSRPYYSQRPSTG